jgi:hypothetical protein
VFEVSLTISIANLVTIVAFRTISLLGMLKL